jgi:hypothetical protein
MRRTFSIIWIACIASFCACAIVSASANAGVGLGPGTISTFAGSPVFGPIDATSIGAPGDVTSATVDGTTYAYIAGNNVVRRIDLASGDEQVVAGDGGTGRPVEGTPATSTNLTASEVAVDPAGDMMILTADNESGLQFVPAASGTYFGGAMTGGDVYTIQHVTGLSFLRAAAIAVDAAGDLIYSTDGYVGVLAVDGASRTQVSASGTSGEPLVGSILNQAVAVNASGDIAYIGGNGAVVDFVQKTGGGYGTPYVLVNHENHITNTSSDGDDGPAYDATTDDPTGLGFDPEGDLLIADQGNDLVRFVAMQSCSSGSCPFGLTSTFEGDIYAVAGIFKAQNGGTTAIPNGTSATSVDVEPDSVSVEPGGDLLMSDGLVSTLLVSKANDDIQTSAGNGSYGSSGDGGPGSLAQLSSAGWVASDPGGDVAIVDTSDARIRFIPTSSGTYYGQPMTAGAIYTIAGDGVPLPASPGGGGGDGGSATAPAAKFSTFEAGSGIALEADGLVVTDPGTNIPLVDRVRFVAARSGTFYGQSMTAGDVYTIGGPSELSDPTDAAIDASGNVLVADAGNGDVKQIAASNGVLSTLVPAGPGIEPYGIAIDSHGDIALSSRFGSTVSLVPASGGEYFAQTMTAGTAYRIAGDGTAGDGGDGATATSAELDSPIGLAFDAAGDLVIAQEGNSPFFDDYENGAVRFMPASAGTFYGQPMADGDIYTLAGGTIGGFLGDGGPGTSAELAQPTSVAMMPGEDVLVADQWNNRVRRLSGSVPTATTGAAGTPTAESDTVAGSVNPQGRPIGYHFEYGATTAYGANQPTSDPSVGSDHAGHAESQELSGLAPDTTYHYRIVADYDEAGATISVPGEDATFTTAASSGESLKTTGPGGGTPPATTTTTTTTPSSPPNIVGPTVAPQLSPALACTTAQVALIDVVQQGSHVEITGAARLVLAGKRVSIKFLATHKVVASATIAANGTFSASASLPPAKIRESNLARYEAIVGSLHSLNLKLDRRMYMTSATRSGAHVLLAGFVTGSFKAGALVKILLRVTCSEEKVIAKVKLTTSGKFSATVPAPTGAASQIAVYRATTTVLKDGHPETTFTLPTPPGD